MIDLKKRMHGGTVVLGVAVVLAGCSGSGGTDAAARSQGASGEANLAPGPATNNPGTTPDSTPTGSDLNSGVPADPATGFGNTGAAAPAATGAAPANGTNVALGGSQDIGLFRAKVAANQVPLPGDLDAAGFFAEHHTELPPPACGDSVCLQPMLGVMGNLLNGANCTMLQLGLNSPIAADPGARPPLQLSVVVDTSGSMATAGKIDFVREGLGLLIDGLTDGDRLALITYSTDVTVASPMMDVLNNRVALREIADGLVAVGSTNIFDGLEAGYQQVTANYDSALQNRVIFLSDGQATAGIIDTPSIIEMSRAYNSDGIGLTTVGLGTDFNVALMRDLALQADGNFYFLENAGAVSEVFTEELSFFTVPIAFDLSLDLRAGSDYTFGRSYGSPFWQDTDLGGTLEVPSVFIAHRESAADITDDGGRRGGGSALLVELIPQLTEDDGSGQTEAEVAVIDVAFREPGATELVTDTVVVNYPRAPWETDAKGFFDANGQAVIQKSFVMLNIFVGLEQAVTAFHENGEPSEAIAGLERLLAAVRDYNEELEDTDIVFDITLLEDLIGVLEVNGVVHPTDVGIPTDPWPAD